MDALIQSQKRFALMPELNGPSRYGFAGQARLLSLGDLFEALNTQVFVEEPETGTGFKLIVKQ